MSSHTVTEVARRFSAFVDRAAFRGERSTLLRGGRPVAELGPSPARRRLSDLPTLLAEIPRLTSDEAEAFLLSAITASELLHGVHRAQEAAIRSRRSACVEGILQRFPVLPVDLATARAHARVWADLQASGTTVGPHDLWLASACLAHGLALATANLWEFRRVPGLTVEDWQTR